MKNAGCEVDEEGTDWLTAGDFSAPELSSAGPSNEDDDRANLIRRIDAFAAELTGQGYASILRGRTFNALVDESGVDGVPTAEPMRMTSNCNITERDMKMFLSQVKLKM